jgi:hypothetical protein
MAQDNISDKVSTLRRVARVWIKLGAWPTGHALVPGCDRREGQNSPPAICRNKKTAVGSRRECPIRRRDVCGLSFRTLRRGVGRRVAGVTCRARSGAVVDTTLDRLRADEVIAGLLVREFCWYKG